MQMIEFSFKDFLLTIILFISGCFNNNNEPVEIAQPTPVETNRLSDTDIIFWIRIKNSGSISYKTDSAGLKNDYIHLPKNDSIALSKAVREYRNLCLRKGTRDIIYIAGEKDVRFPDFEFVISALKKNNLMKYNLITE